MDFIFLLLVTVKIHSDICIHVNASNIHVHVYILVLTDICETEWVENIKVNGIVFLPIKIHVTSKS